MDLGSSLISDLQQVSITPQNTVKTMIIIRRFIIFLSVAFGVLLILNFGLSLIINFQKRIQEDLVRVIDYYADVEVRAKNIDSKTISYKNFLNERKEISPKTKFVLENIRSDLTFKSLKLSHEGFTLHVEGTSTFAFTNLIVRYLEGGMLSEVIIRSANFSASENKYTVVMEGVFK